MSTPGSISSEQAIANLIASYAFLNDDADFEGLASLFEDASFDLDGTVVHGAGQVAALARSIIELREDGRSATAHEISNLRIDVDEAAATGSALAYWTVYRNVPRAPRNALLAGRYDCRFVRKGSVWAFASCVARSNWQA